MDVLFFNNFIMEKTYLDTNGIIYVFCFLGSYTYCRLCTYHGKFRQALFRLFVLLTFWFSAFACK